MEKKGKEVKNPESKLNRLVGERMVVTGIGHRRENGSESCSYVFSVLFLISDTNTSLFSRVVFKFDSQNC